MLVILRCWLSQAQTISSTGYPLVLIHLLTYILSTIFKAYQALVAVNTLAGNLPGTSSVAAPTEDVGLFESNVVQTEIKLGVVGDLSVVNSTIAQAKASKAAFAAVEWSISTDNIGVVLDITGPGSVFSDPS